MKKTITFFIVCFLTVTGALAQTEELLGEYHFNDATTYWQVGASDAITMGEFVRAITGWTTTINDASNGLFRGVSTTNRNYNQQPIGVFVEPKTGFTIWVSKIEVRHKTTATVTGMNQKFSYKINPTSDPNTSIDISPVYIIPTSAADFILETLTPATPIEVTANKFWFYNRIHTNSLTTPCTTEIDYIKVYGTYLDPSAPKITTPLDVKSVKGAKVGGSSSQVIAITHVNLVNPIGIQSNNPAFTASFNDAGETQLNVVYTATQTGFETADITLTSGSASAVLKVKGWGVPDNTLAAWYFDDQTIIPDYSSSTGEAAAIESIGPSTGVYFFNESWGYEINNLYTKVEDVEVPEVSGMKIKNLDYSGMVTLQFDIRSRNASPNTMKVGSYNSVSSEWSSGVYWKNPRTTLGWEYNVSVDVYVYNGELSIVSAFDQSLEPARFALLNPTQTDFSNTTGWIFDNIIVKSASDVSTEIQTPETSSCIFVSNNTIHVINNQQLEKLDILSLNGSVVKSVELKGNASIPVDLKGVYLIRMRNEKDVITQKAVF